MSDLEQYAITYARRGWAVFPLFGVVDGRCECRRGDCDWASKYGKHPRTLNGFKDATTGEEQIAKWWEIWPHSNVGIRTGSGLVVVDVDPRNGGERALEELIAGRPFPRTPTVYTGGGGLHFYFAGEAERTGGAALGPGVDVKGDGGYVVGPPSLHGSGERYAWLVFDQDPSPLPHYLRPTPRPPTVLPTNERRSPPYMQGALASACDRVRSAPVGERNDTLNREAFALFRFLRSPDFNARHACGVLEAAAIAAGLPREEARRTLASALEARMSGAA